jgi:iron(III) transport system substrate-binding protein
MRHATILPALALALLLARPAGAAPGDLVIDGETIADAATVAAAKKDGQITVYSANLADAEEPILRAFEADTGIKTSLIRLTTQYLYPRVTAEFAAGKLEADFVDLTDLPLVKDLADKGILNKPYKVRSFDRLAPALHDPDGRWYSLNRPVSVVGVNTALVKPADRPTRWLDVLDPRWKGKVGSPSIEAGGSAFTMFAFLREKVAPDFWPRFKAQEPRIYPAAAPTITNLVRGEFSIAIAGASQLVSAIDGGAPVTMVFPAEGISGFPNSGGITSSAPHPAAAALFLEWYASKRGSNVVGLTGGYGIHPDATPPKAGGQNFPPESQVWNIDIAHWQAVRIPYSEEWRKIFQ